ncbi:MAG: hypothetical protein ABSD49_04970 [Candidatus Bathyarchaeia archaeon]|jgi:hypothetical protein
MKTTSLFLTQSGAFECPTRNGTCAPWKLHNYRNNINLFDYFLYHNYFLDDKLLDLFCDKYLFLNDDYNDCRRIDGGHSKPY